MLYFPFAGNNMTPFCYIYGEYTFMEQRESISDFVKWAYLSNFKIFILNCVDMTSNVDIFLDVHPFGEENLPTNLMPEMHFQA